MNEGDQKLLDAADQLLRAALYTIDTIGSIPDEKLTPDLKATHYYCLRAIKKVAKVYPECKLPYKLYSTQEVCDMVDISVRMFQKMRYVGLGLKAKNLGEGSRPLYTYESIVEWLSGLSGEYPRDPYMWDEFKQKAALFLSE